MSALLFVAIMQDCLGGLESRWTSATNWRKGTKFGLEVCSESRTLTNLRFADDTALMAQSRATVQKMLRRLESAAQTYGSKISFDKTKILTWNHFQHGHNHVIIDGKGV